MNPITYPARPLPGGRFGLLAKPRVHLWSAKLNGWRTLVHVPTGTMWNRHGEELTISSEFTDALENLSRSRFTWLDCEALERRHTIGRGSLIVLDQVVPGLAAHVRYHELLVDATRLGWPVLRHGQKPEANGVYLLHQAALSEASPSGKAALSVMWAEMQRLNQEWRAEFYEGLVAKREDSPYPIQLRDPDSHCPYWVKHRWW
ncbi:MAG TPA: hypothetical protein VMU04_24860 [Candidatus Acidoferrum sp.]|nr:hypothetical protein [Candidatus Acidoferrum sp.]